MTLAIIDIGSNSVRLMMWADGKTLFKKLKTTRLGEGLNSSPVLLPQACRRTAEAVAEFVAEARQSGAESVYAFATAAVRSAENPQDFTELVKELCGLTVDVVSGEEEAEMGIAGALGNSDGGIIDVGGASTEVTVRKGGKVVYTHSANIGTVRILDGAGRDINKIDKYIGERLGEYGANDFSACSFKGVGGTASRLAAVKCGLKVYDATAIDGMRLTEEEVRAYAERFTEMSAEEIRATTLLTKSADLIGGGAALLAAVMRQFNIAEIEVSESDNLEGYLHCKLAI